LFQPPVSDGAAAWLPGRAREGGDHLRRGCRAGDRLRRGLLASLQILRADDPPTAVFAASNAQALVLAFSEDLAIMSFDGTPVAAMACLPLSVVRQPFEEPGAEATRVLV
jgi:DNA-binding LacI/PurR family transcriptional regulator